MEKTVYSIPKFAVHLRTAQTEYSSLSFVFPYKSEQASNTVYLSPGNAEIQAHSRLQLNVMLLMNLLCLFKRWAIPGLFYFILVFSIMQ